MKTLRSIRIILSVVILLASAVLIWMGRYLELAQWQLTFNLATLSLGALVTWLIITLLLGRIYCSSMCPIGTLQDIAAWLDKRFHHHGKGDYHFTYSNNRIRYLTVLLVLVSMTADDRLTGMVPSLLDPAQLFHYLLELHGISGALTSGLLGMGLAIAVVAGIMWMAYRGGGRHTFCNTICPVGTTLGTVSRVSLYHFDIDTDLCTGCNQCVEECKSMCINPNDHTIDTDRCVMCFNCAATCSDQAIKFTTTRKRLSTPLMQPTT